jgi:hypothetical protein
MSRMIDLIRTSSLSANLMQIAARGALGVPPAEMIEILVYLANHNRVFGQQARLTLAGWDEKACIAAAGSAATPREVLDYFIAPENLRPHLLPALLENPSIEEETLMTLAASGSAEVVGAMRKSARIQRTPAILSALASNGNVSATEGSAIHQQLAATGFEEAAHDQPADSSEPQAGSEETSTHEADQIFAAFVTEHATELAAEEGKPFQPIGGFHGDLEEFTVVAPMSEAGESGQATAEPEAVAASPLEPMPAASPASAAAAAAAAPAKKKAVKKEHLSPEEERGSALQKIARLDIKGRIQLAMKGTKEERSILVRDGTKLVALAVLESPKISDGEVEKFASQKNVLEAVLRQITMKRRFMKNYAVVRNLVYNPRTPLDLSLGLMKNLLVNDLRNLSSNKEVSDTIRKLALKMFKQKSDPTKKSMG